MKSARFSRAARRLALGMPAALLVLAAACTDESSGPPTAVRPPAEDGLLGILQCEVSVASGDLTCVDASGGGPSASLSPGTGPSLDQRTIGAQGSLVRLANSGNNLAGGVYSINVTVQNLANLAMGTSDGATRHAQGVRVFFSSGPTVTGGSGNVTIANATGTAMFTAADQSYFQYGGSIGGTDQPELGAEGVLASAETSSAKQWQFNLDAGVTAFGFMVLVRTETPAGTLSTVAPQVTGVSAATLVPGQTVTLTGVNFNAVAASNIVRIGGLQAAVTGGGATSLDVVVPCMLTGSVPVQVQQGGMAGVPVARPLQTPQRTLAVGAAAIVTDGAEAGCNEIVPSGGASRYVVAVYNTSTSPNSTTAFQISGDETAAAPPAATRLAAPAAPAASPEDEAHLRIQEMSRRENERLRALFAGDPRMRAPRNVMVNADPPPATRTIRVVNLNGGSCDGYTSVNATRVYYNGKVAIYEDDATPAGLRASDNPAMAGYYAAIGDQFNADMEPVIRNNFGDPLLRDASTDANGVVVALFTPLINNNYPGVAGFVISCDQYPTAAGNSGSNFGEYFYAYQPTVNGTGYGSFTPDSWYWSIRATFIHETKHVASMAARVAASAPFELGWLEEGTARHAEELWARSAVYNVAWKANTGYGSGAEPGSLYCDYRQTNAACLATDPSRPSLNVHRHFQGLYTFMNNPTGYSPFGATSLGGSSFYATSWSLVRYAIDRYGASDAAFLTALTSSTTNGTTNLTARAGVSLAQLMGGWALSLYADDYPGLASPSSDIQMPTWNFRSNFAGLNSDFGGTFTRVYPLVPQALAFGAFSAVAQPSIPGGGVAYYELSGTHTQPQLIRLQGSGGSTLPSGLRVAIARLQ
jgi:hypothetical protein